MYSDERAAQMAAYFLTKSAGRMPHLKLMKLMYLADRESLRRYARPMSYDRLVSMPHGPVLSRTLNLISDDVSSDAWSAWIADAANYMVHLARNVGAREDFDELSDADLRVLDDVWQEFGHLDKWAIRDYTHQHCSEWQDPGDSSRPITFTDVFVALGASAEDAQAREAELRRQDALDKRLADYR
jgi:uncharacterized phage-associated protein